MTRRRTPDPAAKASPGPRARERVRKRPDPPPDLAPYAGKKLSVRLDDDMRRWLARAVWRRGIDASSLFRLWLKAEEDGRLRTE